MAKTIVWNHPMQSKGTNVATGIEFESGVPQTVTDAQAEILLAKGEKQYYEGTEDDVKRIRESRGTAFYGTPNPLFGKPLNPEFSLVEDKPAPPVAPVPPAQSVSAAA